VDRQTASQRNVLLPAATAINLEAAGPCLRWRDRRKGRVGSEESIRGTSTVCVLFSKVKVHGSSIASPVCVFDTTACTVLRIVSSRAIEWSRPLVYLYPAKYRQGCRLASNRDPVLGQWYINCRFRCYRQLSQNMCNYKFGGVTAV
jgi:hypothetical protein